MDRRRLLRGVTATFAASHWPSFGFSSEAFAAQGGQPVSRVRPSDPAWPSRARWDELGRDLEGHLLELQSPFDACMASPSSPGCTQLFQRLKNPYFLGDEPALTQTLGWVDAWTCKPSAYAVAAETTADIARAVDFARIHNLRLAVKGGGHSYQGTSNAAESVLIWTRRMTAVRLDEGFVGVGCADTHKPQAAVTVEAGATWGEVYDAVTTRGGRYVQGGGCLTVGAVGLVLSGGFGSFSKAFGTAASHLLEAEIVTADGAVRVVNACMHPDLFWALKGGGGGSLGVVTRITLRTHDLPTTAGAALMSVKATSDSAFQRLIDRVMTFYADALFNPYWGEQIRFRPNNVMSLSMVFQGLDRAQAEAVWQPFVDWLAASSEDYVVEQPLLVLEAPFRHFWDPAFLKTLPGIVLSDDRRNAPAGHVFWASNLAEAGQVLEGYQSAWLPASLLQPDRRASLRDALFAASRHWSVSLHVNKGLAGATADVVAAATETATNPAVLDAFALAISGSEGPPAYPGISGHEPDVSAARTHAQAIENAMTELRKLVPGAGSYLAESNFFDASWRQTFWGEHYPRLLAVKDATDPEGLFIVHHGIGSERWSEDGFSRLT